MAVNLATLEPYTVEFKTLVTTVYPDNTIELQETYFYPTGGGQPHDTGILQIGNKTYEVIDVMKRDGRILHKITPQGLQVGDRVKANINTERRDIHRRVHTATHILCAVIEKAEGTHITGNQLGVDKTRIDVDMEQYDQDKVLQYIAKTNTLIKKELPVVRRVTTREELMQNPSLIKLAAGFPANVQEVHLVQIGDVDIQPCAGTHVNNTKEIGSITFLKADNRGKNNRRIYFTLE